MFSRLFGRILQKNNKGLLHGCTMALAMGVIFFLTVPTAFAQTPTAIGLNNKYSEYFNLFVPAVNATEVSSGTGSGIKYDNLILNPDDKKTVQGIQFDISLVFGNSFTPDWYWDRISDAYDTGVAFDSQVFMIRICETGKPESSCFLNNVPYEKVPNPSQGSLYAITSPTIIFRIKESKLLSYGPNDYFTKEKKIIQAFSKVSKYSYIYTYDNTKGSENSSEVSSITLKPGASYTADFWYCAGPADQDVSKTDSAGNTITPADGTKAYEEYRDANIQNDAVMRFGNLCGKTAYFRIGNPISIPAIPTNAAALAAATQVDPTNKASFEVAQSLPSCSITSGPGFVWCLAHLTYYAIFVPIQWFAGIFGKLFDFFLGYSLSDSSYRADFIFIGWKLVRDISNIFFILILVWAGFSAVFDMNGAGNIKKVLPNLILNALLINFSLFGTRLIVDISNITARLFYNVMQVCEGQCVKDANGNATNLKHDSSGYWPLSEKIVSSFNPQQIFNPSVLNGLATTKVTGTDSNLSNGNVTGSATTPVDLNTFDYAGYYIVVSLIAAAIMFGVLLLFWKVSFIFLGRVIGLYIVMIFSPFAVLSRNMPGLSSIPQLSWKSWAKELFSYATLAPLFVFFLYIIYAFLQSNFLQGLLPNGDTGNFFDTVIHIAVPMLIVYFMIKAAAKLAEKYSGEFGARVSKAMDDAVGIGSVATATVAGIATGGVAAVGRGTLGRAGSMLANSNTLREWSASNSWLARKVGSAGVGLGERGMNATYDARNTGLFKAAGITGKENKSVTGALRLKTDNTKGGVAGSIDRKEKRGYARMKSFQLSGDMKAAQDAKASKWDEEHWEGPGGGLERWKNTQIARGTNKEKDKNAIAEAKKNFIKVEKGLGNVKPDTADQINLRRNTAYGVRQANKAKTNKFAGRILGLGGSASGVGGAIAGSGLATGIGAVVVAAGGEYSTEGKAQGRIGANIGRLKKFADEIDELNAQITPLQNDILAGNFKKGNKEDGEENGFAKANAQMKELQSKLRDITAKRDKLNEQLTKKD